MTDPATFAELAVLFHNAVGLYRESRWYTLVRMTQVSFDDWGVRATVEPIPTPGLRSDQTESWTISSAWPYFTATPNSWSQSYVSVRIEFDPELVAAVVEFAKTLPTQFSPDNAARISEFLRDYRNR